LHELAVLPHLTTPIHLVDRRSKYPSQASHLVRSHQIFHLDTITRILHLRNNSRTFINRVNFLWSLNLVFVIMFLFFLFLSFFLSFFIPALLTPSSLFCYPYSHSLHSPSFSCTIIHCSPSQLLFLPLLIHSFPCLHLPFRYSPNLSPYYPSFLHIHHLLISLLYPLHTIPAPCNT
jgi:hypothetical protein